MTAPRIAVLVGILCAWGSAVADTSNISVTVFVAECTDGIDNDGDSRIDYSSDSGCSSFGDDDETDPVLQACEDGTDNDGDGLTDYPSDPGCDAASDSSEVNISSGGGGGGGGGGWTNIVTPPQPALSRVTLSGRSAPLARIRVFADARLLTESMADGNGAYAADIQLTPGLYTFGVSSQDDAGRFSAFVNVPMRVARESRATIEGILLSPTLATEYGTRRVIGQTLPNAIVYPSGSSRSVAAGPDGRFSFMVDAGETQVRVRAQSDGRSTPLSIAVMLPASVSRAAPSASPSARRADMNDDGRVDVRDFSVMLFWYKKPLSPKLIEIERARFNGDGKIDFTDFSIMAFQWTG